MQEVNCVQVKSARSQNQKVKTALGQKNKIQMSKSQMIKK